MKSILRIAIAGFLLLFTGCSGKRVAKPNLDDWLENHFPGRFQVLSTRSDDPIRSLSFQVKRSVVAEKSDSMVQALLWWDPRKPDLDISAEMVDSAFEGAATRLQDAKALYEALKSNGFENFATSIRRQAAIFFFVEPTPEQRREILQRSERAIADWPATSNYDKELVFMEPEEYGKHFQDIVPLTYWEESSVEHPKNVVFSLECRHDRQFIAADLEWDWKFNTRSRRYDEYSKQAGDAAAAWAEQNLKPPYTMLRYRTVESAGPMRVPKQDLALLVFSFPFVNQTIETPDQDDWDETVSGYVVVDYNVDAHSIETIKYREPEAE